MSAERSSKLCSEAQALQSGQEQRRAEPAPYGDHEPEESGKSEWAPSPDQSGTEDATSGARARVRREEVQTPREKKTFSHLTVKQQSQAPGSGITATHQGKKSTSRSLKACSYRDRQRQEEEPRGPGPFYFIGGGNGAEIVSSYCESKGWKRIYSTHREDFTLKWCQTKSPVNYCNFRAGEQLVYQIPNNKVLTTKIGLLCSLREYERVCCKVKHGQGLRRLKMEEFIPATFRMDVRAEREAFFAQQEGVSISDSHMWICKPTGLNQGKGIFLLKNQEDVVAFKQRLQHMEDGRANGKIYRQPQAFVAQHYIQNPLLLKGKKFDVRSYLLIACTAPYMVFFRHGYVRLTCDLYDPSSNNLSAHLTNQYMQKKNPLYSQLKEDTVWSMESFNAYVNDSFRVAKGLPGDWVMGAFAKRMQQIMTHCFLAVKSKLHCQLGFFDLIGCDFLIDEHFKVWLLEMNCNPALHTNCEVLKEVIPSIVVETLDLTQEIFSKCRLGQKMLPLASQREFVLLYNGVSPPDLTLAQRKSNTDDDLHLKGNKKTQKTEPRQPKSTSSDKSANVSESCDETGLNADSSTQSVRRKNPRPRVQMKLSKCVLLQRARAADAKHSKTQRASVFMALSSSAVSDDPSACEKTSEEELRENVLHETKQEV